MMIYTKIFMILLSASLFVKFFEMVLCISLIIIWGIPVMIHEYFEKRITWEAPRFLVKIDHIVYQIIWYKWLGTLLDDCWDRVNK